MRRFFFGWLFVLAAHTSAFAQGVVSQIAVLNQLPSDQRHPEVQIFVDPRLATRKEALPLKKELKSFIGANITDTTLDQIKEKVSHFFFTQQHRLASVIIAPQDVSDGTLQVTVLYSTLDEVTLTGNRWTSSSFLLKRTGLKPGKPLHTDKLENNLAWLNHSPFRRTDLILLPGSRPGTTSVQLATQDRFPLRPYIGGDNTGTSYTSYARWFAGFEAGNLWGIDHQTSYQFTTASDPFTFIAHNATYTIPFAWKHQLYTYGGWSRTNGDLPEKDIHNRCVNWQVSPRYQMFISPLYGSFLQTFTIGYDFKRLENELLFKRSAFTKAVADINQLLLSYTFQYQKPKWSTSWTVELFAAPFQMTADQTDSHYEEIRPFAASHYGYMRLAGRFSCELPYRLSLASFLRLQGTAWNLLPSEQMGIGGYNTVRGYEERGLNVDNALIANLELFLPSMRVFRKRRPEKLQLLAFIDYGWGQLYHADNGQSPTDWMLGVGPGLRYLLDQYVTLRADLGFPLHSAGLGRQGIHLHVGGSLAF